MTDTTDTKALIDDVCLAAAGIHNLGRSVSDERAQGVIDFIRSKLESAFEAERQRADDAERANRQQKRDLESGQTVNKVLQATLKQLKGEQVPVGKFVFEPSGERWHHIKHGEHQHAEPKLKLVKLFTAPQKPVVLLNKFERDSHGRMILDGRPEPQIGFASGWNAAIEAAGGIVKDG